MPRTRAEMIEHLADVITRGDLCVIVTARDSGTDHGNVTVDTNAPPGVATHMLKHGHRDMFKKYGDDETAYPELDCEYRDDGPLQSD